MQTELNALIARAQTASFIVEVIENIAATPCDMLLSEGRHVVAMQRQRLQTFSTGRFERMKRPGAEEGVIAGRDFENIGRVIAMPKGYALHVRADGGLTETVRCAFTPETLRRLVGRHRGRLPPLVIVQLWREIMAASSRLQGPFTVAVTTGAAGGTALDLARDYKNAEAIAILEAAP